MTTKIGLDTNAIAPFSFDGHGVNDANGQRICKVTSCDPYIYPDGQAVRNAEFDRLSNLIAAAPELLEALELLARNYCPSCGCDQANTPGCDYCNCIQIGRAAIRKAKGEA